MSAQHRILGRAGGGLNNATWAQNAAVAKIGQAGESKTADLLNRFAMPEDGPTVLHDLMLPSNNRFKANVDHIVVSGRTVHIIDSKVWKPGRYWTLGGKTRRGFERFEPAEKRTMELALEMLSGYLANQRIAAEFATPLIVIWPSSTRKELKTGLLRVPGANVLSGADFTRYAEKKFAGSRLFGIGASRSADPAIVNALAGLLVSSPQFRHRPTGTEDFPF